MRPTVAATALVAAAVLVLALAPPAAAAGVKPTDKSCVPFKQPPQFKDLETYARYLDRLTTQQLDALYYNVSSPASKGAFPLAGCTLGWVPGGDIPSRVTRLILPNVGMGWSGKCFGFEYNATTGTPTDLTNAFSPNWLNLTLPQRARVAGEQYGKADVYWSPYSNDPGLKGAVWRFNYRPAAPLMNTALRMTVEVNAIRDEVREFGPGAMIGRMYVKATNPQPGQVPGGVMPIYFMIFQACAADGSYAVTPKDRALPKFGAQ